MFSAVQLERGIERDLDNGLLLQQFVLGSFMIMRF